MSVSKHVEVRMYDVGFGDCFLLTFPGRGAGDRRRRVLIDCGTHPSHHGPAIGEVVARVIKDATDEEGRAVIDVVVATHRHRDHVSGFESPAWDEVVVGEVWMPWTEHPTDPEARRIRDTQGRIARHLALLLEGARRRGGLSPEFLALEPFTLNSLTNEKAMVTLHQGFAGEPVRRFLPHRERGRQTFKTKVLPGVIVHAIGPSRDPDVIRDMEPPAGRSYLRMIESSANPGLGGGPWAWAAGSRPRVIETAPESPERSKPLFAPEWVVPLDKYRERRTKDKLLPVLDESEQRQIEGWNEGFDLSVAEALEKSINGTSLMLMFSIGQAHLLFPGDAQWGTWRVALDDPDWHALLEKTVFYKVGHHGSHNATPREFVHELPEKNPRVMSMVSTRKLPIWPNIPMDELLKDLRPRTKWLLRSDQTPQGKLPDGVRSGDGYYEASIPVS